MALILTHEKSDFDAVASQLAAHKLYPEATPLLSRQVNRNVRQFLNLYWEALPFVWADDWQRQRVRSVILVDTHSLNSVRGVIKKPQVLVIDHHTEQAERPGWTYHVEPVGATVTVLVERLQSAGLGLTPEEATLLLLGIYEDTGSLTYDAVVARDVRAAAWLMEQGAQLGVVRRFLAIPLTDAQLELYGELQSNAEWLRVHGESLVVAMAEAPAGFDDEISSVAHRLRETLAPAGLFVAVQLGNDVQLVARSSSERVDAAFVARAFAGGGHPRAAAALIVGQDAASVCSRVKELLPAAVTPMARVAEIMSRGVQTVDAEMLVGEAAAAMQRLGHEGYPVVAGESERLVGLLTRRAVDRAMGHDLAHLPIRRIMKAGTVTVRPDDSIERLRHLMLSEGWGQIPVVAADEDGAAPEKPTGIVTRTDLLNYLFQTGRPATENNLRRLLAQLLPPALWGLVLAASKEANALNMPLFFVGGLVRDLLLRHEPADVDLVVEGDAIALVDALRRRYGGTRHAHKRFGTAKWFVTPGIWRDLAAGADDGGDAGDNQRTLPEAVDFVTARTEFYREPTALPEVSSGSIKLDLHRRDFTINTLAIRLDGAHLGDLLDFYGGRRDLENGEIRVLHSLSFVDDPTRILRAVRLEQRLGFHIEPRTAEQLADSLSMLPRVSGARLRHEIEQSLLESDPAGVLRRLQELDVLSHICPDLVWTEASAGAFAQVPGLVSDERWQEIARQAGQLFLYFALLLAPLPAAKRLLVAKCLRVRKSTRQDIVAFGEAVELLADLPPAAKPSEVERGLRPFPARVLLAARIWLEGTPGSLQIERYLGELRFVRPALTGDTLQAMGLKPGPLYAELLDRLRAARLDGEVSNDAEERELLRSLIE